MAGIVILLARAWSVEIVVRALILIAVVLSLPISGASPVPETMLPATPGGAGVSPTVTYHVEDLAVGQPFAQGVVQDGGCKADFLLLGAAPPGAKLTAVVTHDTACRFSLAAKDLSCTACQLGLPVPTPPPQVCGSGLTSGSGYYWMYGGGGSNDQLTWDIDSITFSWTCSTATLQSISGSCHGATEPYFYWQWIIDGCWWTGGSTIGVSQSQVHQSMEGDYHCSPTGTPPCNLGSGYYHHLYLTVYGSPNGGVTCGTSWTGTIVNNVGITCGNDGA